MNLVDRPFLPKHLRLPRLEQHEWQPIKLEIHQANDFVCTYCETDTRTTYPVCDHKIPLSRGGTNHPSNLTTSCPTCNARKGELTPEEFSTMRASEAVH